jgi:hypothetical protein
MITMNTLNNVSANDATALALIRVGRAAPVLSMSRAAQ